MLKTSDFNIPTSLPFGMLGGYEYVPEKGQVLAYILKKCIENGTFESGVETECEHPVMVADGLLKKIWVLGRADKNYYLLTTKALGLLYSVYGKEQDEILR